MASWKVLPDPTEKAIEYTPFLKSRRFFAVDDSGSTAGAILRKEREFVDQLRNNHANPKDSISLWGSDCDNPTTSFNSVSWRSAHGGTYPSQILKKKKALDAVRKSDVWFLITDGEVYDSHVHDLASMAHELQILNVPIVFIITGSRGRSPLTTNISVGISFFASTQDALILFKETQTGKIYVIASKGCFAFLGGSAAARDLESWNDIQVFNTEAEFCEHCEKSEIQVVLAESRQNIPSGVSLGPEWERAQGTALVEIDALLEAGFLSDEDVLALFAEEAFNNLAVAYKTRRRIPELRAFVQAQKIEQVAPKLEDVSGAKTIISQMANAATTAEEKTLLQERLRAAHAQNRARYQSVVADFSGSPKAQAVRKRNQLVDSALRSLASIEAASFSADILSRKSNRARRAEVVTSDSRVEVANLDLEGPAFKGYCFICCGENEIMSICLKELDTADAGSNTTDFALNFPLAAGNTPKNVGLVSSQHICFQCALLNPSGMSVWKEELNAIIPTVQYDGNNKKYINDQLYLALTAGLQTGAAGVAQLFMAILSEVINTKTWAGAGMEESQMSADERQRKTMLHWMFKELVTNTRTRQTFSEVGDWCAFPEALRWAAEDYRANCLTSFAVTYPVSGYITLTAIGKEAGIFDHDLLSQMRSSKITHQLASKYLADLQAASHGHNEWKQTYLAFIYKEFNGNNIPKDLGGPKALVTDVDDFRCRLGKLIHVPPLTGEFQLQNEEKEMHKLQLMLFWLIYGQTTPCTAKTFFTKTQHDKYLASAVLDPSLSVPETELHSILLSIFIKPAGEFINAEAAALHDAAVVPFTNPFGASVIKCGSSACGKSFIPEDLQGDLKAALARVHEIRDNRTKHLIQVYGIRGRFEKACTGLPEVTAFGAAPSSVHINLHIAVARTWAEQTGEKRCAIVDQVDEREEFVAAVRKWICDQGRGDIYNEKIDEDIRAVLPSFFTVLYEASKAEGGGAADVTLFRHDFEKNKLEWKTRYELEALRWK